MAATDFRCGCVGDNVLNDHRTRKTLPAIGTDRSRPILKGYMHQAVDSLRYVPIDAECHFGYQMQMTVDLTVEMLLTEKSSIRDNGLQAPLMIEWE